MAEFVIGAGKKPTVRAILPVGLERIRSVEGEPLKVVGRSHGVSFEAERDNTESEFVRYRLMVDATVPDAEAAITVANDKSDTCTHQEVDGKHIFHCPSEGVTDYAAGATTLDAICGKFALPEVWHFEASGFAEDALSIELLFRAMVQYKASDLHLTPGQRRIFRVDNKTRTADIRGPVSATQILNLLKDIAPEAAWEDFQKVHQCNFSFHQAGLGFARVSAFQKMGAPHMNFRYLPEKISSFDDLGIPTEMLERLANMTEGLVLIAGMGGSGKSTTAAAILEYINLNRNVHILTIEDPIEIMFESKRAFVSQRNLGVDVKSFTDGVQGALRQDPDVVFIGEMSDVETIRAAISAASTGVLVVSTLNSANASGVVNRIVSFFDPVERDLIRQQLGDNLRGVLCQKLLPREAGGRIPAIEVLYNDIKPISTAILEGSTLGIRIGMQQNLSHSNLFEHYIFDLYKKKIISVETAKEYSPELSMFEQILMGTYSVPRIDR